MCGVGPVINYRGGGGGGVTHPRVTHTPAHVLGTGHYREGGCHPPPCGVRDQSLITGRGGASPTPTWY